MLQFSCNELLSSVHTLVLLYSEKVLWISLLAPLNEGVIYPRGLVRFLKVNGFDEPRKFVKINGY
jgi:hypothetical protein